MKHIKKFYESDSFKEPIDVEMDVIEFRKNFNSKIGKKTSKILNDLIVNNPTMTDDYNLYQIWAINKSFAPSFDDKIIKAVSEWHARIRLSNFMVGKMTGEPSQYFFDIGQFGHKWKCVEISEEDVDSYIKILESEIEYRYKKLEELREL